MDALQVVATVAPALLTAGGLLVMVKSQGKRLDAVEQDTRDHASRVAILETDVRSIREGQDRVEQALHEGMAELRKELREIGQGMLARLEEKTELLLLRRENRRE